MPLQLASRSFGELLREWRQRRRLSQLELASRADVSSRHLSFLETGRARPSAQMVLHLSEKLDVPLLERNALLVAGGHAPLFRQTPYDAPEMAAVREAVDLVVNAHDPYPAFVADRLWNLVTFNAAALILVEGAADHLLAPPLNAMRLGLHPDGMAPKIINFEEYSGYHLARLRRQVEMTGDPELTALYAEVSAYPGVALVPPSRLSEPSNAEVVVSLRYRFGEVELGLFNAISHFGMPIDATLDDLAIEFLFPADPATAEFLRRRAERHLSG